MRPEPDLSDPALLDREYGDESRLVARRRAWSRFREGPSPDDLAFDSVVEAEPGSVLDLGCGWGELADRIERETGARVAAIDRSPRMAALASDRGVPVVVGDAHALPFRDGAFDVVVANAVLYHLGEMDVALTEVGRVLRRSGRFVATTFASDRFSELWASLRASPPPLHSTPTPAPPSSAAGSDAWRRDRDGTASSFRRSTTSARTCRRRS